MLLGHSSPNWHLKPMQDVMLDLLASAIKKLKFYLKSLSNTFLP